MNIIGTDMAAKEKKTKKIMKIIIILIVVLLLISVALFGVIYYLQGKQFKFSIDGKTIGSSAYASDLFVFEGNEVYVSIKDISTLVNYYYFNGGYKEYTESEERCYLESANEIVTFENESDIIYKTPENEIDYTYYKINAPIKRMNDKLYITMEGLCNACNLQMSYNKKSNKIVVYTLQYLTNYYMKKYTNAAIADNFNNQKALLYGLLVVQNVPNTSRTTASNIRYGINNLNNEEIVGMKYTQVDFIEGTEEFIVTTEEKKVGIITSEGITKVSPQYESLKQIDKDLNLYLAKLNGKYGVVEKNGKILIYMEYDQIGIDPTQYQTNNIKNKYILFDNAIPVKRDGVWGMFDVKGNIILPIEYVGLGCISRNSVPGRTTNNILTIPEIKGIVISKQYEVDKRKYVYYGIIDEQGNELVPPYLETVYSIIENGKETYTMINNGNSINVIDYVQKQ